MPLKIILRRMGRKKAPHYRIVVAESTMPRDGRFVANVGHYNPTTNPATLVVDRDRALAWLAKGATPTETVQALFKKVGVLAAPVESEEPMVSVGSSLHSDSRTDVLQHTQTVTSTETEVIGALLDRALAQEALLKKSVQDYSIELSAFRQWTAAVTFAPVRASGGEHE